MIKQVVKQIIRSLGWELHRSSLSSSAGAQLLAALEHVRANIVLDIGANTWQFSKELRLTGFTGTIISFEPLSSAHLRLMRAARSDLNWSIHPRAAVGDHDGEIKINIAGNSVSSSVLPMLETHSNVAVGSAYTGSERVALIRLDTVAKQYMESDSRPFIKIDTQGYEWQVLDGATETLKVARGVLLELSLVPLYEGQHLWRDFIERMELEGFIFWAIQNGMTDPHTGRSLQVDVIFLRA